MTSSTPDALWSAPSVQLLRPAGIAWADLRHGRLLDGCSLSVPVGVRLLVVADPEASASLLLRVLAGLSPIRHGRIEIAGSADGSPEGWGRRAAYLGPEPGIRAWMTPREALRLSADLLGLSGSSSSRRMEEAISWARIPAPGLDRPVGRGGPGMAQRTALAAVLLGDPEVILLDEPLRAIDPIERQQLLRLSQRRRTVLLASRYPASEAGLVTHVVLLRRGRVALRAPIGALEAAGLPLSMHGISTLADLRSATPDGAPTASPASAHR